MAQTYKKALRNAKFTTLMGTEKTVADNTHCPCPFRNKVR